MADKKNGTGVIDPIECPIGYYCSQGKFSRLKINFGLFRNIFAKKRFYQKFKF